jgi:peptidoglycan/LPS O-acetylase OafA/YrhL
MGEASYSLYILHRPLHDWFLRLEQAWGWPTSSTLLGASLYLGGCLALSVAALKWIEHPCRDWIKRGFPTRPKPAEASPVSEVSAEPKPTFIR